MNIFIKSISYTYFYNTSCIRKDCLKIFNLFTSPLYIDIFYVIVCIEIFRYLRVYKKGDLS